jgi:hypothetical protein
MGLDVLPIEYRGDGESFYGCFCCHVLICARDPLWRLFEAEHSACLRPGPYPGLQMMSRLGAVLALDNQDWYYAYGPLERLALAGRLL